MFSGNPEVHTKALRDKAFFMQDKKIKNPHQTFISPYVAEAHLNFHGFHDSSSNEPKATPISSRLWKSVPTEVGHGPHMV
ncbi:hypothetical protein WISP_53394 [Willisornis vidua]|uniref:Uncharacterized protein n=1 Tax=Willisornis vidua TaxID=1566151 RepID=A0ABQ9DFS3_9PASS|nr:hypothetical protein WISP_53394 [Willisornis vidua]